MKPAVCV